MSATRKSVTLIARSCLLAAPAIVSADVMWDAVVTVNGPQVVGLCHAWTTDLVWKEHNDGQDCKLFRVGSSQPPPVSVA